MLSLIAVRITDLNVLCSQSQIMLLMYTAKCLIYMRAFTQCYLTPLVHRSTHKRVKKVILIYLIIEYIYVRIKVIQYRSIWQ